ncbi:50S ribosomal protein L28, partial [Candidatus Berkelbacteria bacterium CG_4_9_14_0_2_um_filter_42_30]
MAVCSICGKIKISGSKVSHSQRHTKRYFRPNLQKINGAIL